MHNLFLRNCKDVHEITVAAQGQAHEEDLLNDDKMAIIDQRLSEFKQGLTDEWVVEEHEVKHGYFDCGRMAALDAGILCVLSSWTYPCAIPASLGALCEGVQTPVSSMHT